MSFGKTILTGLARLFGVSLVELAADREGASRQLADAAASAADVSDFVEAGVDHYGDTPVALQLDRAALLEGASAHTGDGVDETDAALETFAEQLGRDPDDVFWKPVDRIKQLPDRPQHTYIWLLEDGVDPAGFADQIDSMYREEFGRPPRGLHVPVTDVSEIKLADPGEIRTYVKPHLERAEKVEEHEEEAAELIDPASASPQGGD